MKIVAGLFILILTYLSFSSPGKIVIDSEGSIDGIINQAREVIQGNKFWLNQLKEASSDLKWELDEPDRNAEDVRYFKSIDYEIEKYDNELYAEFPELKPTHAQMKAESLRNQADQIEQDELYKELEKTRLNRIIILRELISTLTLKVLSYEQDNS